MLADSNDAATSKLSIAPVQTREEQRQAIELLCSDLPGGVEVFAALKRVDSTEGMWVARVGDRLLAALWLLPSSSDVTLIMLPVLAEGAPASLRKRILAAAVDDARQRGCGRIDAFVRQDQQDAVEDLRECGFLPGPRLAYLAGDAKRLNGWQLEPPFELIACRPEQRSELVRVIEQTYIQSLDCVGCGAEFDAEQALRTYTSAGACPFEHWYFLRVQEETVGCLLLSDLPEVSQMELCYMGVRPEFRGNRYGEGLAKSALKIAGDLGRERVVLAVDCENHPAYNGYMRAGFVVTEIRQHFSLSAR